MLRFSPVLQIDLRDDPKTITKLNDVKEKPIVTEQGQKLAKEVRHKIKTGSICRSKLPVSVNGSKLQLFLLALL